MQTDQVSDLLADVADRLILPRFGSLGSADIHEKGPGDLVTVADREAELELGRILLRADPDALIVGEEGVFTDPGCLDDLPTAAHAWVIDPVDGTRNFARGRADFAVILAEVCGGVTTRGWIWQPVHQRLYVTERGSGVTRNGQQLSPPPPSPRSVALGATYLPVPGEEGAEVEVVRSWGSCGIDYPKLIEGEVDFLSYRSMFPWDHLAGGLMATELGGRIATDTGVDYHAGVIGRRLLSAATPQLWQTARDALFGD
ncbi:MAG TPA: inositol monophosphatase [Propionicimonas sp.]|mgnify:CR=1 FL=1|nr:inositol monophosphatase [Propionicimonas sp.]HRA05366.1 inositol monophosphatase [Propionicimonas sp.]